MAAWKIAPALAAGCHHRHPPSSSSTSLSLLPFAQKKQPLAAKGVLNVITGPRFQIRRIMHAPQGFNKLAFTGSTEVGCRVGIAAAELLIPSTLELAANLPISSSIDMPFDKARSKARKRYLCSTKAKFAAPVLVSSFRKVFYDKFVNALAGRIQKKSKSAWVLGRRHSKWVCKSMPVNSRPF